MLAGFDQLFGFAEGWGSYENDYLFFWYRVKEVGHLSNFSAAECFRTVNHAARAQTNPLVSGNRSAEITKRLPFPLQVGGFAVYQALRFFFIASLLYCCDSFFVR